MARLWFRDVGVWIMRCRNPDSRNWSFWIFRAFDFFCLVVYDVYVFGFFKWWSGQWWRCDQQILFFVDPLLLCLEYFRTRSGPRRPGFACFVQKRSVFHIFCFFETSYPEFTPIFVHLLLYSGTGCEIWIFSNSHKSTFTLKNHSKLQKRQNHQNEEIKKLTRSYLFYFLHFRGFGVFAVFHWFL